MAAYYNEIDPFCVEWLKNLIVAKFIAAGDVDSRSITEVTADDVKGYTQCHFFAGIAGWSYALRLAGIPDDADVWTGSCPCQPFSNAGKRKGFDDERHLWPEFARLIGDCQPSIVFGEQVSSKVGREWLSVVRSDLEALGYAVGAADLCAASVGAPHIRQRLWWVAHSIGARLEERQEQPARQECTAIERSCEVGFLEHAAGEQTGLSGRAREQGSAVGELGDAERFRVRGARCEPDDGTARRVPSADRERQRVWPDARPASRNPWSDLEWLPCVDGKWRPTLAIVQRVAPRLSASMVSCSSDNEDKAEKINGQGCDPNASASMQTMWSGDDEEALRKSAGGPWRIYASEVLQPNLHGKLAGREDQSAVGRGWAQAIAEGCEGGVRALRRDEGSSCASHRRESAEQQNEQPPYVVLALPQAGTFAALRSDNGTEESLQILRETSHEARLMLDTQYSPAEIWRSLDDEGKGRLLMAIEASGLGIGPLYPIGKKEKSRAARLKGYGNAIVPQVAAEFIAAAMEYAP